MSSMSLGHAPTPQDKFRIKVVRQEDSDGCAAGALATLLSISYTEAKAIIPAFRQCGSPTCSKCRYPADASFWPWAHKASAGHLAGILRANGYTVCRTGNIYSQDIYPVLVKICWGPLGPAHFFVWDPQENVFLCPSGRIEDTRVTVSRLFRWSDEPAYIVKHPKFLPVQKA